MPAASPAPLTVALALALMSVAPLATAQTLQQRIDNMNRREAGRALEQLAERGPTVDQKMRVIIEAVVIEDAGARQAFDWWSRNADIPLVIDWNALEMEGIDPDQRINVTLSTVPAYQLLNIIMRQASPDLELIYEATPWYVRVMTKRQANRDLVLRVYDVQDLVAEVPSFTGAPSFDLNDALSNTNSGGSSGGSGGERNIFGDDDDAGDREDQPGKAERGDALAQLVMDSIEPELWLSVDGANVRYFNGRLIINAPRYVHRQIGVPTVVAARDPLAVRRRSLPEGARPAPIATTTESPPISTIAK